LTSVQTKLEDVKELKGISTTTISHTMSQKRHQIEQVYSVTQSEVLLQTKHNFISLDFWKALDLVSP